MIFDAEKELFEKIPLLEKYIKKSKDIKDYCNNFLNLNDNKDDIKNEVEILKNINKQLSEYSNIIEKRFLSYFNSKVKFNYIGRRMIIEYPSTKSFLVEFSYFSEAGFNFNIKTPNNMEELDLFDKTYKNFLKDKELYKNVDLFKSFLDFLKFIEICKFKLNKIMEEYNININILKNKTQVKSIERILTKNNFKTIEDFIFSRKDQIQDKTYTAVFYTYKFENECLKFIKNTLEFYRCKETQNIIYYISNSKNKKTQKEILNMLNHSINNIGGQIIKSYNSLTKIGITLNKNGRISYESFLTSKMKLLHNVESF